MASYNCCTTKNPPSPDSHPPYPIMLRCRNAPLKSPIPAPSGITTSRFSKTEYDADIRPIFEVDNSDSDDDQLNIVRKKRSGTIAAITKLREHLSRETIFLGRQYRSIVGNSEEGVERRKQQNLLQERKIQEELSFEDLYDDDARSLSTLTTRRSPSKAWHIGSDVTTITPNRKSMADTFDLRQPSPLVSVVQRRHSSATLDKPLSLESDHVQLTTSLDLIPSFPVIEPQKPSSIIDSVTRRTSWRLSFASEPRGTSLRALSLEYKASPPEPNGVKEVATGPLRWFRSQATLMSPPNILKVPTQPEHPGGVESPSYTPPRTIEEDFGGVDGGSETNLPPVALHDMQISRRLASRGLLSHSSSPQLSSWGSQTHHGNHSSGTIASQHRIMNRPRFYRHNSSVGQAELAGHHSCSDFSRYGVSSFYPSTDNIAQLNPRGSRLNLSPPSQHQHHSVISSRNPSYHTLVVEKSPHIPSRTNVVDKETTLDAFLGIPSTKRGRQYTMSTPTAVSDTSSFLDREVELDGIKTWFPFSLSRLGLSNPMKSKFTEDMNGSQSPQQTRLPTTSSLLRAFPISRVAKLVSKSFDGADPLELQMPISRQGWGYEFTSRSRSSIDTVSPGSRGPRARSLEARSLGGPRVDPLHREEGEVAGMWAQALKRSHHEHVHYVRRSLATRDRSHGRGSILDMRSNSWKLKNMIWSSKDHSKEEIERLSIESKDLELELELERKARGVETDKQDAADWVIELEARERQAKAKSEAVGRKKAPRTILPESWACYPSHTRSERTASAGPQDEVEQKDFAIENVEEGEVGWKTGERKHHHHHHQKEKHHSLPIRVTNQIRATLYKLRTTKSSMMSDSVHGRKSSVSIGGKLEHPELELLPGEGTGYGLLQEVEDETEAEMRRQERAGRMVIFADGGGSDGEFAGEQEEFKTNAHEMSVMNIANPKFYDDCVAVPLEDENEKDGASGLSALSVATVPHVQQRRGRGLLDKKNPAGVGAKYGTWSGREGPIAQPVDRGLMRRSTTDFHKELERIEVAEHDRVLRTAAEAWA